MRLRLIVVVVGLVSSLGLRAQEAEERDPPDDDATLAPSTVAPMAAPTKTQATTPSEAWTLLPSQGDACEAADRDVVEGGMRAVFCRALLVYPWKTFVAKAPALPFRKGPHKNGLLNLNAERDFGRYDPKFVVWATSALLPASHDPALRAATQSLFDLQFSELAHVYFLVDKALSSDPAWVARARQRYLAPLEARVVPADWSLADATSNWGDVLGGADGHDPNSVRAAAMWWVRRHHDGTAALWRTGLTRLLSTYDAAWLAAEQTKPWTSALPPQDPAPAPTTPAPTTPTPTTTTP